MRWSELDLEGRTVRWRGDGLGWHGFRRQFATDLEHVPLPDLQELGGWQTPETLLECYQVADEVKMLDAVDAGARATTVVRSPKTAPNRHRQPTPRRV